MNCFVDRDILFPLVLFIILKIFYDMLSSFHKVLVARPFSAFFLYKGWYVLMHKYEGVNGVNRLVTKGEKYYRLPTK